MLVDWDWEAKGLWLVSARSSLAASTGFHDLLSAALLADLKAWNDRGGDVNPNDRAANVEFRRSSRALAQRVQDELGSSWDVLYNAGGDGWAWTWVEPPWRI